jgi:hypothetical protein
VGCTVVADTPAATEKLDKIIGKVRFRCDSPGAENLTLKIRVERNTGDQWHSARSQTFSVKGADTLAPGLKYQSREVQLGCGTGSFRTVVDWSRVSRGDTKGDNLISGSMPQPCQPLIRFDS